MNNAHSVPNQNRKKNVSKFVFALEKVIIEGMLGC